MKQMEFCVQNAELKQMYVNVRLIYFNRLLNVALRE